jgi:hypothetical protein
MVLFAVPGQGRTVRRKNAKFVSTSSAAVVTATSLPAGETQTARPLLRRIKDVVNADRAASETSGITASSLDPKLVDLAQDSAAFLDSQNNPLYIDDFSQVLSSPLNSSPLDAQPAIDEYFEDPLPRFHRRKRFGDMVEH